MPEKEKIDVKFITSVALAHEDVDCNLRHFQISIVQETESKNFRCFFDVFDPKAVKLADEMPASNNA